MATGMKKKKTPEAKRVSRARVLPLVPTPNHGDQALYLYGVSPATAKAPAITMLGIDGEHGVKAILTAPAKPALISAKSGKDYLQKKAKAIAAVRKAGPDDEVQKLASELEKLTRGSAVSNKVSSGQQGLQWQSSFLLPRAKR